MSVFLSGDQSGLDPPDPIPNSEVKSVMAHDSQIYLAKVGNSSTVSTISKLLMLCRAGSEARPAREALRFLRGEISHGLPLSLKLRRTGMIVKLANGSDRPLREEVPRPVGRMW